MSSAAAWYRYALGRPAHTFADAVWVLGSRPVEALRVSASLGTGIRERLLKLHPETPVYAGPAGAGAPEWTFIVRPRRTDSGDLAGQLTSAGVEYIRARAYLDLPPTRYPAGALRWLAPPRGPLPEFRTVASAALCELRAEQPGGET